MRMRSVVVVAVIAIAAGCGKDAPEKPKACAQLYQMLDQLETCTTLPSSIGKDAIGAKRKAIDELIKGAKAQGDHEGMCRNEAWVLRKIYERTAPGCLK